MISSLTYDLFGSITLNFYIYGNCLAIFLLISSLIAWLWENTFCRISILSNLFRLPFWPNIWSFWELFNICLKTYVSLQALEAVFWTNPLVQIMSWSSFSNRILSACSINFWRTVISQQGNLFFYYSLNFYQVFHYILGAMVLGKYKFKMENFIIKKWHLTTFSILHNIHVFILALFRLVFA